MLLSSMPREICACISVSTAPAIMELTRTFCGANSNARLFSLITWMVIKVLFGLRVSEEEEYRGVDVSECGLEAYPEFTKST